MVYFSSLKVNNQLKNINTHTHIYKLFSGLVFYNFKFATLHININIKYVYLTVHIVYIYINKIKHIYNAVYIPTNVTNKILPSSYLNI